ncbi:MAG: hypothetical protein RIG61_04010 [Deltaproteobacteria bacterium]
MSLKTAVWLTVILLLVLGLSQLFGVLREKNDPSSSYLRETVNAAGKVRNMGEERKELIKKQEETLLEKEY